MTLSDTPSHIIQQIAHATLRVQQQAPQLYSDTSIAAKLGVCRHTVVAKRLRGELPMPDSGRRTSGAALAKAGVLL